MEDGLQEMRVDGGVLQSPGSRVCWSECRVRVRVKERNERKLKSNGFVGPDKD